MKVKLNKNVDGIPENSTVNVSKYQSDSWYTIAPCSKIWQIQNPWNQVGENFACSYKPNFTVHQKDFEILE